MKAKKEKVEKKSRELKKTRSQKILASEKAQKWAAIRKAEKAAKKKAPKPETRCPVPLGLRLQTAPKEIVMGSTEIDWSKNTRVIYMGKPVWVKISEGNAKQGWGIVDDDVIAQQVGLKLGDAIRYHQGTDKQFPVFKGMRRIPNQLPRLKKELAEELRDAMLFRPPPQEDKPVMDLRQRFHRQLAILREKSSAS